MTFYKSKFSVELVWLFNIVLHLISIHHQPDSIFLMYPYGFFQTPERKLVCQSLGHVKPFEKFLLRDLATSDDRKTTPLLNDFLMASSCASFSSTDGNNTSFIHERVTQMRGYFLHKEILVLYQN